MPASALSLAKEPARKVPRTFVLACRAGHPPAIHDLQSLVPCLLANSGLGLPLRSRVSRLGDSDRKPKKIIGTSQLKCTLSALTIDSKEAMRASFPLDSIKQVSREQGIVERLIE